jgi:hypothetical protein
MSDVKPATDDRIAAKRETWERLRYEAALEVLARLDIEKARADAAERRVAELEAERQWRPIETAPKDGTRILLYRPDVRGEHIEIMVEGYWSNLPGHSYGIGWRTPCFSFSGGKHDPTHWQPLPSPPAS